MKLGLGKIRWLVGLALLLFVSPASFAVQIVTENPNPVCEEIHLNKELKIYKDPTLFLSNMSSDGELDPLMNESPLLTTVKGTFQLMRLGPPREFRNFGPIAKIYELAEPKLRARSKREDPRLRPEETSPLIIPIKVCGGPNDPYGDTLGFILASDLKEAQLEEHEPGQLPPSTYPNPIPDWKQKQQQDAKQSGTATIRKSF